MGHKGGGKRLSGSDRREAILQAAAIVFSQSGYAGATTQGIARRANISEALLYRHFESKMHLYRAVLRDILQRQDRTLGEAAAAHGAEDLVGQIRTYLTRQVAMRDGEERMTAHRVTMASLVGDGRYARIIYHRALRLRRATFEAAFARLRAEHGLTGDRLDYANAFTFVEHVGAMLALGRLPVRQIMPYAGSDAELVEQALLFCIRGLGLPAELCRAAEGEGPGSA